MKKVFFALSIFLLSIPFYSVKAMERAADILKKNVVTEGDGLYVDSTIDGRYIYKGGNPNNYIKLGDDIYRIISVEKDGTIKVIKQESIGKMAWDEGNARYSTNSEDFCTSTFGCKAWGSNTTTLDTNGNKVTQMSWTVNGTLKNLPDKEASLNTYLNNDFYNGLSDDIKSLIVEGTWNVGPTSEGQTNLSRSVVEESIYKWKGKIALINMTDYVIASTKGTCKSVKDYAAGNFSCYNLSDKYNYLYTNTANQWMLSSNTENANNVFFAHSTGYLNYGGSPLERIVRPAFYLSSETILNGEGTETNPYIVSKYVEEPKDETDNNNKDEDKNNNNNQNVNVDNGQVVEVPSTSAQMSIIIASIGIIFVSLAVIITKKMTKKEINK